MFDGALPGAPLATQEKQFDLMARSGVESVRMGNELGGRAAGPNGTFDYDVPDPTVRLAAERGMSVLPVLLYAPPFARLLQGPRCTRRRESSPFQAFLRAVVRRYGSNGRFWIDNPDVPRRPIRHWQMWNEPN